MSRGSRLSSAVMRLIGQKVIESISRTNIRFRTVLISLAVLYLVSQLWGFGHKDVSRKSLRLFNQMHNHLWYGACTGIKLVKGNIGDGGIVIEDGQHRAIDLLKVTGIPVIGEVTGNYDMYAMSSNDIVSTNLIRYKQWEYGFVREIIDMMEEAADRLGLSPEETIFVDIGANIGSISFPVAARGFKVIAIEAMDYNVNAMRASLCLNPQFAKRVTVYEAALGKEHAECNFFSGKDNVGDAYLSCDPSREASPGYQFRSKIYLKTLDELFGNFGEIAGRVGALKIDVEGAEPWIVRGGKGFFEKVRPLAMVTEVSNMSKDVTGISTYDYMKFMNQWYDVRDGGFLGRKISIKDLALGKKYAPTGDISNMFLTIRSGMMEAKKGYLFAYNSTLCSAWAYVFAKMCQTLFVDNLGVYSVWENVDSALKVAQTAALLEVVHAAIGLVRSPVFITATQVASRIWILWGIICLAPESTTKNSVQFRLPLGVYQFSLNIVTLLTAWCLSEVIRYGFFACKEANSQPKFLVWLRYSGFLVLYPLGVSSELAMVWLALPSLKANKTWSIELPNPFNFGFSYYYWCIIGVALYLPGFPKLYIYMLSQRSKVLGKAGLRKKTD